MHRLRKTLVAVTLTTGLFGIVACGSTPEENSAPEDSTASVADDQVRTISHELGETEIKGEVNDVIALEFAFVDSLDLLGTEPVGVADDNDQDRITQLNSGTELDYTSLGTRSEPNMEVIASLRPDLIIADTDRHANVYEQLSRIAPTIVLNSREGRYDDMKTNTVTIAEALGEKERGEKAVADHEQRMEDIAASLKNKNSNALLVTARDELLRLHTSNSFVGSIMEELGISVPVQDTAPYEDASLERIAEVNPDVLLVSSDVENSVVDKWKGNPLWENMTANKEGHSYKADRNLFTRFRGLNSAEAIAQQLVDWVNES